MLKNETHIHVHVHSHEDGSLLRLVQEIHSGLKEGKFIMALSPEMQAFVEATSAALTSAGSSLANITADIQRLLAASSGLSEEDKAALTAHVASLNALATSLSDQAAVVPEP